MDANETLSEAVVREVFEETGIKTEFEGVLGCSEFLNTKFDKNDLYFMCLVRPTTFNINACDKEIEECKWMDVEEFVVPKEKDILFWKRQK